LTIRHRPREFGRSKYGVTRIVKGFLDLLTVKFLTGFGQRPQHLLGTVGLGSFFLGALGLAWLGGCWAWSRLAAWTGMLVATEGKTLDEMLFHLRDHPTAALYSVALLLLGGQLMSIGFLGELIIAYQQRDIETYSIAERIGSAAPSPSAAEPEGAGPESP
jgi:dolichol-phosphate mannosyltransferase